MLREACADLPNVTVDGFTGLLVDFCRERGIPAIVKGLRAVSDFDYELQMAQMNASPDRRRDGVRPDQPGVVLPVLVSLVKEVATFGGDVSGLVPDFVHEALVARVRESDTRE